MPRLIHVSLIRVAPYGQQGMGGFSQQQQAGQQGNPPYFSPPQQTPPGPAQSPYLQPRPPPQQPEGSIRLHGVTLVNSLVGSGEVSMSSELIGGDTLTLQGPTLKEADSLEAQQETYGPRGPAQGNSGKANNEDGVPQDRPSSLPGNKTHINTFLTVLLVPPRDSQQCDSV
ncbi:Spectrin beta chain non-erythrocytic 2 [Dissostichus eleginoides]|uniref:Spectrin beta chain non-erythrocytic 2 n=1 Tax=Dissostichus eleginoides TaxID=100907 RepID=A0AAD9C2A4_DISEL|nr:Spectrin beta chain non-erythrocytic 2 [Dissostichus eleginoides]